MTGEYFKYDGDIRVRKVQQLQRTKEMQSSSESRIRPPQLEWGSMKFLTPISACDGRVAAIEKWEDLCLVRVKDNCDEAAIWGCWSFCICER